MENGIDEQLLSWFQEYVFIPGWDFGRGCWLGLEVAARGRRSGCDFVVVGKLNFLVWIEVLVPLHMLARFKYSQDPPQKPGI